MLKIQEVASLEPLSGLKKQYIDQTTAPLDGMWLTGFVPLAKHYAFYKDNSLIGYCCLNEEAYLLQFLLSPQHEHESGQIFRRLLRDGLPSVSKIEGAFVSTAEPRYMSLCLDHFTTFEVNALMYQQDKLPQLGSQNEVLEMTVLQAEQLSTATKFVHGSIGAPEEWLKGYLSNLISRKELFGLWEGKELVATGENRAYDSYQRDYADLGVIVGLSHRGRGLATQILKHLLLMNTQRGLKSICSTEKDNFAAQKAISRAGFFASNRIVQFKQ